MAEICELAENAIVNYLSSLRAQDGSLVWPSTMQEPPPTNTLRIFPGESDEEKTGQCILCIAGKEPPEHIPSSANYEVDFEVWLRTPTRVLTDDEKTRVPPVADPLTTHEQAAEQLRAAIMANGLELALTAAQAGFTVWGIKERRPLREDDDKRWASGHSFVLVCCAASFPN